ncbi:MAG TPA: ATP-dependent RNA helicase HrpA [Victivallales bacterium]|nr:ATP-dependent RNA helicase HrpA [Victivallales bacterium]
MEKNIKNHENELLLIDRRRLSSLRRKINNYNKQNKNVEKLQTAFNKLKNEAIQRFSRKRNTVLKVNYPNNLPITNKVEQIKNTVSENQVIIVCGTTGSGKTTQLPKMLYNLGYGKFGRIGCTQPRRLAATGMARRVALEMDTPYGKGVGCQVRFNNSTSDETYIKFMTDGILLSETINDKLLLQYDALIIDEAHERSLNIDFILGYIKQILIKRPDFKIIISSATLDAESFSAFFNEAPIITVEGKVYPIEDFFLPHLSEEEDLSSHILRAVNWISDLDNEGDILTFLPGEREIRDAVDILNGQKWKNSEILPLFGRLNISEQQRVFKTGNRRRIILSTNVAETSITIPGISYVIDSGLVRLNRYNAKTHVQSLQVEHISQASSKQRRGRCGRVSDGICVYLYDKETLEDSPQFTDPEICRSSLAGVILQMKTLNLPALNEFPLIDTPKASLISEGYRILRDIEAIDKDYELTENGRTVSKFPIDPHLAKIIISSQKYNVLHEILIIVSFLCMQDPKERHPEKQTAADQAHKQWINEDSDFIAILNLWNFVQRAIDAKSSNNQIKKLCRDNFVNFRRIKEWINLYNDLSDIIKELKWGTKLKTKQADYTNKFEEIHCSLLSGFPDNISIKGENNQYIGTRNRKFNVFPGSVLFKLKPKWMISFALIETTKLYARMNAVIDPEWVEKTVKHLCKYSYSNIEWDSNRGFVTAQEAVIFRGLQVHSGRKIHYGRINSAETRNIFIRDAIVPGNIHIRNRWLKEHLKLLKTITSLENKIRRPNALLDTEAIYIHYDKQIPDNIYTSKAFDRWVWKSSKNIAININEAMIPQMTPIQWSDFPDKLKFFDCEFKIKYKFNPGENNDGIILFCKNNKLHQLPDWCLDWIVPGWLPEKIKLLIKTLPKQLRIACNPIHSVINEFLNYIKHNPEFREQHLIIAMSEFLVREKDIIVNPDDFDIERIPGYLKMKIAEIDDNNKIIKISEHIPLRNQISPRLSSELDGIQEWIYTQKTDWPAGPVPEKIKIGENSKLIGYPALVDEIDSIGQHVFMNSNEAEANHKLGLIRLFKLHYSEQIKFLTKKLPINKSAILTLGYIYNNDSYKEQFINNVIYNTLSDNYFVSIRDKVTFDRQSEHALSSLFVQSEKLGAIINTLLNERDMIINKLNYIFEADKSVDDISSQLDFLFKPDFVKTDMIWTKYAKYLKALLIRIDRLKYSREKDLNKLQDLIPYQKKLDEFLITCKNTDNAYDLQYYAWLLQEYRIKIFAPEVQTNEKVSAKILDNAWDAALNDRLKFQN